MDPKIDACLGSTSASHVTSPATPAAISGNHGDDQTFSVACSLVHGWAMPKLCALAWLRIYNQKCLPKWTENELRRKVANAAKANHIKPCGHLLGQNVRSIQSDGDIDLGDRKGDCAPHVTAQPQFDRQAFSNFVAGTEPISARWLAMRSPICPWNRTPASFLHALYRKGENIVVFDDYHSQGQALWTHPGVPYAASTLIAFTKGKRLGVWFLCNPVDGQFRINDEGNRSRRSHQNITAWRYMVVESDRQDITAGEWLAALVKLPLHVVAIYETGGRLPHALLLMDAPSKQRWDEIRVLKKDPKCILFERDELIGMLAQWEMKGHEMDRSFYLEAHTGLHSYCGVRVVRGEFRIPILCLSLFGGIQPIKLVQFLRDPKLNLSHDGAIQRFQLLVYPNPIKDYTYTDQSENTEAKNRFFAVLEKIAGTKDFQDFGAIVTEYENVPFFAFDNEAQQIFKDWLIANEKKSTTNRTTPSRNTSLSSQISSRDSASSSTSSNSPITQSKIKDRKSKNTSQPATPT